MEKVPPPNERQKKTRMPILMVTELAESEFPLMPFREVDDPDFLGDEMRRNPHCREAEQIEEGEKLFLLEEPTETITVDRRVAQLIESAQLATLQMVVVEQFLLHRKNILQIAHIVAGFTHERVHIGDIELALACAFDKMREYERGN